ncbi:MAG: GGDEF domain-containing protein [Thermodesulfobacteriota bacterium]
MLSPNLDLKPAMQPMPSTMLNMDTLMSELDYHRRKAEQLALMNELHGRLARAIDLPGMIEALSVWLLPMVEHELIAYNNPVRHRRYLFCSCHGPKRRKVMGLARNLLDQGAGSPDHGDEEFAVQQWRLDSQLNDRDNILLVCRNGLSREAMLLVKDALQVLREPLLRALEYEDLFEMANRDALTGLANRRVFEERIGTILENAKRHNRPVSLASMDLDHFKQINDTLGHAEGDRVLQKVARVLGDTIRSTDLLVRMGGDEFVLVLNETNLTAAQNLANRICRAVDALDIRAAGGAKLGISIGIVQWQPGMDKEALLVKSDEILYRAKAAGRSRVHVEERLRFS